MTVDPVGRAVRPACRFVILTPGRSGSSYTRSCLNSHPNVICYPELFVRRGASAQAEILDAVVDNRLNRLDSKTRSIIRRSIPGLPNRDVNALGFKVQLQDLHEPTRLFTQLEAHDYKMVYLKRKNIVKSVVSKLNQERLLREYGPGNSNISDRNRVQKALHVHPPEFLETLRFRIKLESWHDRFAAAYGAEKRTVFYEDLLDSPEEYFGPILELLGVKPLKLSGEYIKHTPDRLSEAIENYDEIVELARGTRYAELLSQ